MTFAIIQSGVKWLEGQVTLSNPLYNMCYGQEAPHRRIASLAIILLVFPIPGVSALAFASVSPANRSIFRILLWGAGYVGLTFLSHRIYVFAASALLSRSWLAKAVVVGIYEGLVNAFMLKFIKAILFNNKPSLLENIEAARSKWTEFFKQHKEWFAGKNIYEAHQEDMAWHRESINQLANETHAYFMRSPHRTLEILHKLYKLSWAQNKKIEVDPHKSFQGIPLPLHLQPQLIYLQKESDYLKAITKILQATDPKIADVICDKNSIFVKLGHLAARGGNVDQMLNFSLYGYVVPKIISLSSLLSSRPFVAHALITPFIIFIKEVARRLFSTPSEINALPHLEDVETTIKAVKQIENDMWKLNLQGAWQTELQAQKTREHDQEIGERLTAFFAVFNEETTGQA